MSEPDHGPLSTEVKEVKRMPTAFVGRKNPKLKTCYLKKKADT